MNQPVLKLRNLHRRREALVGPALLLICVTAVPAIAQDSLESCRRISDIMARVACYDALPTTSASAPQPVTRPEVARGEAVVESAVARDFSGWGPNERIALENGQVWQIVDGSTYATSPGKRKAAIRRGVLGADFLDVDGVALSPRVRRVK